MSCKTYELERTWGRDEGTPELDNIAKINIAKINNVQDTGLTEKQRQIQLLKNMDNKKTISNLGYCKE